MIVYVDTSAVIKRVVNEPGSDLVLDVWGRADDVVSSEVVYAESRAAIAAIRRAGRLDRAGHQRAVCQVESVFGDLRVIRMDETIATVAGGLADEHSLRGFDAVHLAAALSVDAPRIVVTTWDRSLSRAALACGMPVVPREPARAAA
jgi:predicted nucleic acid-binding protein